MPYTSTGRWFEQAWFDEMGVQPAHPDPTDAELTEAWQMFYRQQEETARLRAEAELHAEAARREAAALEASRAEIEEQLLRGEVPETHTFRQIVAAFTDTLFNVISETVPRLMGTNTVIYPCTVMPSTVDVSQRVTEIWTPTATVEMPVYHPVPGYQFIINARSNQVLSIKTTDYEILCDEQVYKQYAWIFEQAQIRINPTHHHVSVSKDRVIGRTTYGEFAIPDFDLFPGTESAQEVSLIIQNSNDGTKKNRMYTLMRFPRGNMRVGWVQNTGFSVKHRTGAMGRLVTRLQQFLRGSLEVDRQMCNRLAGLRGQQELIYAYLQNNRLLAGERNAERLTGEWMRVNSSCNLWDVYMVFVTVISESYGHNFGTKLARLEMLNQEVQSTWHRCMGIHEEQVIFHDILYVDRTQGEREE